MLFERIKPTVHHPPPLYADLEAVKLALLSGREYIWQPAVPATTAPSSPVV